MALSRDARLVARVRRGDSSAFEALHARHQPAVLAFCRHLTGNVEDAEDAVQHTFLAAYRRIVDSSDALELRPWLFAVARNRSLSLLRARRESTVADPDAAPATLDGLAVEVERRQELRDLVDDMSRLPESQRAALVLSQLDALSYREIGSVLEVPPEKVKALVFQARSSLASTREAREAPCFEIRSEIATARGSGLRRRLLRRHVGQCDGCREFEVTVMRQRRDLAILLPVAPSAGLGPAILEAALGREGAATAGTGGAVAATGGAGGAGLAGTLAALGGGGAAKLAVVAALAGSATAGAVAADLPDRIQPSAATGVFGQADSGSETGAPPASVDRGAGGGTGGSQSSPADEERREGADGPANGNVENGSPRSAARAGETAAGDAAQGTEAGAPGTSDQDLKGEPGSSDGGEDLASDDDPSGLPPGLAKRDELPHGLAKREELPPGLAKGRDGAPPGNGRGNGNGNGNAGDGGNGNGNGNSGGGGNPGVGQGNGNGNAGAGQGNGGGGNAGGQGTGGATPGSQSPDAGQGGGAPPGPAGGEPGDSGGGNGGGQGNGKDGGPGGDGQGNGNAGGGSPDGGQGNGNGNGKPK